MEELIKECLFNLYSKISFHLGSDMEEMCKKAMIPFTQIFNLNNDNPYDLKIKEANIIRIYIGLYDNGQSMNIEYISRLYKESYRAMSYDIGEIMRKMFNYPNLIEERNALLKEGLKSEKIKEKILNSDLEVLDISEHFLQEFRNNKLNTVNDLINMDSKTMKSITEKLSLEIFPLHIINCIHDIGLRFNEEIENEIIQYKHQQKIRIQKIYKKQQKYIDNNN